jgi:DNA-binding transcriptional ArsR family regulator
MTNTKTNSAPTVDTPLADFFRALGDEHRLRILRLLATHRELSVSELGEHLKQSQPAVSHHLSLLKDVGLIGYRRDGRFNRYALDKAGTEKAIEKVAGSGLPASLALGGLEFRVERLE